jgi:radical SAM-linked protein
MEGQRCRCAFGFRIEGDLRFLSHRDVLRLFARAVARAALPVRFTEGFNPHPRITLPLPRPVGVASEDETLIVEFAEPVDPEDASDRLAGQVPAGLSMVTARLLQPAERLQPIEVDYRLDLGGDPPTDLEARMAQLEGADVLEVERSILKKGQHRIVDIRPYLGDLRVDGDAVTFTLRVTDAGTAKPAEVAALLGLDPGAINHRIRRLEVRMK